MSESNESGNGKDKKAWVVIPAGDAFRVFSPANPIGFHTVRTQPAASCTCDEHKAPGRGERGPCSHISAVLEAQARRFAALKAHAAIAPVSRVPAQGAPERRETTPSEDAWQMLLKRSVSPDGRIDSLSVEFSLPVAKLSAEDIKASAKTAIALQSEIVEGFRGERGSGNGNGRPAAPIRPERTDQADASALYATIVGVEAMDTRWGRRLYLAFRVGNERLRLFGSDRRLGEILRFAGYPDFAAHIEEGLTFDLPCRVKLEPSSDGRYMNVRRVFPADGRTQ